MLHSTFEYSSFVEGKLLLDISILPWWYFLIAAPARDHVVTALCVSTYRSLSTLSVRMPDHVWINCTVNILYIKTWTLCFFHKQDISVLYFIRRGQACPSLHQVHLFTLNIHSYCISIQRFISHILLYSPTWTKNNLY